MGPSSAGAIGWMQFMPSTWERWGMDANGDGVSDPWNPDDAIFAAARYLAAAGGRTDIARGIFAYNHAQWYVDEILGLARLYGQNGFDIAFTYDRHQANLQAAEKAIATQNRVVDRATLRARRLATSDAGHVRQGRCGSAALEPPGTPEARLPGRHEARRRGGVGRRCETEAEGCREGARAGSAEHVDELHDGVGLLAAPFYQGDYVFPVGGGPSVVSVGHYHHDYPAADIAAPAGSPLYALTDGFIVDAWPTPTGNCGIGLTIRAAGDGRTMDLLPHVLRGPGIQPGIAVAAGQPVGLVGSTGARNRAAPSSPASTDELVPAGRALVRRLRGHAFRWQDAPTMAVGPVFDVIGGGAASPSDDPAVITFTVERS